LSLQFEVKLVDLHLLVRDDLVDFVLAVEDAILEVLDDFKRDQSVPVDQIVLGDGLSEVESKHTLVEYVLLHP